MGALQAAFTDPRPGAAFAKVLLEGDEVPEFNWSAPMQIAGRLCESDDRVSALFNGLQLPERSFYMAVADAAVEARDAAVEGSSPIRSGGGLEAEPIKPAGVSLHISLHEAVLRARDEGRQRQPHG
jgi:hypothetical protein